MTDGVLARLFGVGRLTPARFAAFYVSLGRREGVLGAPTVDADAFVVRDGTTVHRLASVYRRFLSLPRRAREGYLVDVLHAQRAQPPDAAPRRWDEVAARLLPRLRDGAFLDRVTLGRAGSRPASCPVARGLFTTLVIDDEQTMTSVSTDMLTQWEKSFEEAAERARKNLIDISLDAFVELTDGLWVAPWEDAYAASRLLLPHLLQRLAVDPLVAVPNRDTLLVARTRSAAALEAMVIAIEGAGEVQGYPLTRRIFQLQGGELVPYELPSKHPAAVRHHNLCVDELLRSYAEQQPVLQEHAGDTVYVASLEADEAPDGRLVTRALWSDRTPALLPRADRVHLLQTEEIAGEPVSSRMWVASWDRLAKLEGALEATDHFLPRYRTGSFPDGDALRRHATPVELDRRTAELDSGDSWR